MLDYVINRKPSFMPPMFLDRYWHELIDSHNPISIDEPKLRRHTHNRATVSIYGSLWKVLDRSTDRYLISYGDWEFRGYEWTAWGEWLPASEAVNRLKPVHDVNMLKMLTEPDLEHEIKHLSTVWRDELAIVSSSRPRQALKSLFEYFLAPTRDNPGYARYAAERGLSRASETLKQRAQASLPPTPSADEVREYAQFKKREILGQDWKIANGLLYHHSWRLQRIAPA